MHTQLWVMLSERLLKDVPANKQVDRAADILRPLAEKVRQIGCTIGLYNHGGWFGNVDRQIAIIKRLERDAIWNVGIVYNLHHGHHELKDFSALLTRMQPYLYALNLNGMKPDGPKILPIGQGDDDAILLATIKESGYRGPIGILNHREDTDAEVALQENLTGLRNETAKDAKNAKDTKSAAAGR
jgi:sugar phosphate isomerase/epimerase